MEILSEFYKLRFDYYGKRKDYLESMLGAESAKLDNIARFIVEKIEGKIKVENLKKDHLVKMLAEKGYESDPVKKWKEKMTKEKGYFHEGGAQTTEQINNLDEDEATSNNDFNYLLSMPIWNLTLEKKEEILKQQKQKGAELKALKAKTVEQLWLDDLNEFKEGMEKFEVKEREDMEISIKKNIKTQKASVGQKYLKNEYLPDPIGQRIESKVDAQMMLKAEKDAQAKVLIKAKKEESLKGLNLVDIILDEGKLSEEQERQIKELASSLANPNKAKAAAPTTTKATSSTPKKEKEVKKENGGETAATGASGDGGAKPKKAPRKEKEKITIDTDSEASFDEIFPVARELTAAEKRQTARAKKEVRRIFYILTFLFV